MHVAATIASEVNDELLHAFHVKFGKSDKHLGISLFSKVLDMKITRLVAHHVVSIDANHGNVSTNNSEVLQVFSSVTLDAELDLRAFGAFEAFHDIVTLHTYK